MRTLILAAVAAGTTLATPALAQSAAPHTGLRVEGLIGYDRADTNAGDSGGVSYGGAVGYDVPLGGHLIGGIEAEASGSTSADCDNDFVRVGDQICTTLGRDLYVGARLGVPVGSALLYAKGGYTNAHLRTTYEDGTTGTVDDFDTGNDVDGWRAGAGAEIPVGPNSYVKAEYRYSNYDRDLERHQVMAGFGFRF